MATSRQASSARRPRRNIKPHGLTVFMGLLSLSVENPCDVERPLRHSPLSSGGECRPWGESQRNKGKGGGTPDKTTSVLSGDIILAHTSRTPGRKPPFFPITLTPEFVLFSSKSARLRLGWRDRKRGS